MPFVNATKVRAASLPPNDEERMILEFLLQNAIGSQNAQPWSVIEAHLASKGKSMSQTHFQQGILKQSRENDYFIGSNDHGSSKGYFIIENQRDAKVMRDWYQKRIDTEQNRLNHLKRLASSHGWIL